jgi:hypothetical protein
MIILHLQNLFVVWLPFYAVNDSLTIIYSPAMAPKKRMTAKKRMFGDLENEGTSRNSQAFHLQNANIETVANLQNRENMSVEGLEEFDGEMRNDRVMAKKNVSRRRDFFEHLQNEGTSVDGKNSN